MGVQSWIQIRADKDPDQVGLRLYESTGTETQLFTIKFMSDGRIRYFLPGRKCQHPDPVLGVPLLPSLTNEIREVIGSVTRRKLHIHCSSSPCLETY
jgi:hypothetical protein